MYLITCTECRTEFSSHARLCPSCGKLTHHVHATLPGTFFGPPTAVLLGESNWKPPSRA